MPNGQLAIRIEPLHLADFVHPDGGPSPGGRGSWWPSRSCIPTASSCSTPASASATRAEWAGTPKPGESGEASAWDPAAYRASVARLRALAPDRFLFGHDRW